MSKVKKKRNKKYTGADAAQERPNIIKVQAVSRTKASQWIYEKKRLIKISGTVLLIVVALIFIVSGIVSLF